MFNGCTSLNRIKMLATNISAGNCLYYFAYNTAATGTFVKDPSMTTLPTATADNNYTGVPEGWTIVDNA